MTSARAPRVAVVGPRRVRTGLGPFLAKHLIAHGAEVPAFIASRKESIEEGHWALRNVGIDAEGFVDLDTLLAAHPTVDAVVIASPHETHRRWIDAAIGRGLHVLCEKPLVWGDPSPDWSAWWLQVSTRDLVLFENCPWPYALPAFRALHPDAGAGEIRRFEMEMAPSSTDPKRMLVDAMSHPLSVLQAFRPLGHATIGPRRWIAVEEGRVEVEFSYSETSLHFDVAIRLRSVPHQPRPLAIVVDGRRADRRVQMPDYTMSFADGARSVPLPDPMSALVGHFVRSVRDGEDPPVRGARLARIRRRDELLREIVGSFPGT